MKKTFLLLSGIILCGSCTEKKTCPLCNGQGEVAIYGTSQVCALCGGEEEVDEKTYNKFFNDMRALQTGNGPDATPSMSNTSSSREICPLCSGTGTFVMRGLSSPCSACKQTGYVSREEAANIRQELREIDQMYGGDGYDNTSIDYRGNYQNGDYSSGGSDASACSSCNGTGQCKHCLGTGVRETDSYYGEGPDAMECPICNGSGDCNLCYGTGSR